MDGLATPKVSVGLPVWNGEAFLQAAVDSLLAQSFEDFELIISDNASTDQTESICRGLAVKDKRIRCFRNDSNIGLQANTQKVLDLASAPYFMWASHDDLWDPSYISRMVNHLDNHARCVIAGSNSASIDQAGNLRAHYDNVTIYSPATASARARRLICASPTGQATLIFGLMRTEAIKSLRLAAYDKVRMLNRGKYAWDKRALFRMVFQGDFHVDQDTLFFHRDVVVDRDQPRARRPLSGSFARFRRSLAHGRDLHGYFADLRGIVVGSDLARREKASLVGVAVGQELRYLAKYYGSRLRR